MTRARQRKWRVLIWSSTSVSKSIDIREDEANRERQGLDPAPFHGGRSDYRGSVPRPMLHRVMQAKRQTADRAASLDRRRPLPPYLDRLVVAAGRLVFPVDLHEQVVREFLAGPR